MCVYMEELSATSLFSNPSKIIVMGYLSSVLTVHMCCQTQYTNWCISATYALCTLYSTSRPAYQVHAGLYWHKGGQKLYILHLINNQNIWDYALIEPV